MQADVARDLSDSAFDFLRVVWPAVKGACGGGELVPVEAVTATDFAKVLDMQAGIDAWQVVDRCGMRGIASRIQWGAKCWSTFTIRFSRTSGARTEYAKRCWALEHPNQGWLIPSLTVQAYVEARRTGTLLGAGLVRTKDLFDYVREEPRGEMTDPDAQWFLQSTYNAQFIVVPWIKYRESGRGIFMLEPILTTARKE